MPDSCCCCPLLCCSAPEGFPVSGPAAGLLEEAATDCWRALAGALTSSCDACKSASGSSSSSSNAGLGGTRCRFTSARTRTLVQTQSNEETNDAAGDGSRRTSIECPSRADVAVDLRQGPFRLHWKACICTLRLRVCGLMTAQMMINGTVLIPGPSSSALLRSHWRSISSSMSIRILPAQHTRCIQQDGRFSIRIR